MPVTVKNLFEGFLPTIQAALYTVPVGGSAIVMDISLVNNHTTFVDVNLLFRKAGGGIRRIAPKNMRISKDLQYQRQCKVTMGPGDSLEGIATVASVIDTVISGVEQS